MKNAKIKAVVGLLTILVLPGCSFQKDTVQIDGAVIEEAEEIQEEAAEKVPEEVDSSTEENEDSDNGYNEPAKGSQDTVTVSLPQFERYGEIISLNTEENVFTKAVADDANSSYGLGSFVVDLDKDGKEEAIVVNGSEEEPDNPDYDDSYDYWYVEHAWIVDSDESAAEIQDFSGCYVAKEQYLLDTDSGSFIALNGYMGMDGIGAVYTSKDGQIVNASESSWLVGQKFFISDNELLWNVESYNAFCMVVLGSTPNEIGGGGRSHLPYRMYLENGEFYLYGAKEISLEEAQSIADIDTDGIANCDLAQFILRDNNELDVNFVVKDIPYYYNFYTNIYSLSDDKKTWELEGTIEGYMDVDLQSDNTWEVLSEEISYDPDVKYDVPLEPDQQIESSGYVDLEEKCYHVSVGRKASVDGEYDHLKDFFFIDDEGKTLQFEVDYPSKSESMDSDRYVFAACDFDAKYIDVTFDGKKDVVISLGHAGASGDMVYCAYVYENGDFVYVKSFESIPNYTVNEKDKCIEGEVNGEITQYIYSDHEFVCK